MRVKGSSLPNQEKERLRSKFRERRLLLSDQDRKKASLMICDSILQTDEYAAAKGVAAYWPLALEVDIRPVIDHALKHNRRLYLPRVVRHPRQLELCLFSGDPKSLAPGPFGLKQPCTEAMDATEIDLVIVPALAFDIHCQRLGYGTGYYDRFLKTTGAFRALVAFDDQIAESLPTTHHDVAMDIVITQSRQL
jgi:5-formyltetrahydrofolate cyclo-ligase